MFLAGESDRMHPWAASSVEKGVGVRTPLCEASAWLAGFALTEGQ